MAWSSGSARRSTKASSRARRRRARLPARRLGAQNDWARADHGINPCTGGARRRRRASRATRSTERRARRSGRRARARARGATKRRSRRWRARNAPEPSRAGRDEPVVSTRGKAAALLARAAVRGAAVTAIDPDRAIERGTQVRCSKAPSRAASASSATRAGRAGAGALRPPRDERARRRPRRRRGRAAGQGGLRSSHRRVGRRKEGS